MNPYHELANAIIVQAVKDYRMALKRYFLRPQRKEYQQDVAELERFFTSEWFEALSELDGPSLMKRVRSMVRMEVSAGVCLTNSV